MQVPVLETPHGFVSESNAIARCVAGLLDIVVSPPPPHVIMLPFLPRHGTTRSG